MKPEIKFGTDGWRAVIADTYTFTNVQKVAQATGRWLFDKYGSDPSVVIGYDCRFLGAEFAERTAQTLATMGVQVHLSPTFVATPVISWAAKAYGCNAGIVITASHNPPKYNGFKIKADFGGPATPEQIAEIEAELVHVDHLVDLEPVADLKEAGRIKMLDMVPGYLDVLRERLDIEAIRSANLKIAYDAMFGAGQGLIGRLLGTDNLVPVHHDRNPGFHGQAPEPIAQNLTELPEVILREGCAVGLATDGDADRIGMFDEHGRFVDSHRILSLLVEYLYNDKNLRGAIVKSFSVTDMLAKMGKAYNLPVYTTKIGFKHIASYIVEDDVLVGGEESGGLSAKGHIPERDGIFIGLLIVEMMVKRGKKLSELVQELFDKFGPHYAHRNDLHITEALKQGFLKHLRENGLQRVAGQNIVDVDTLDGFKFRTDAGRWVMVRPSGTEPVLRVYSEAETPEAARALVQGVVDLLGTIQSVGG